MPVGVESDWIVLGWGAQSWRDTGVGSVTSYGTSNTADLRGTGLRGDAMSRGNSMWSTEPSPLRKYGGLGALATVIVLSILALTGVPEGLDRPVIAVFMLSFFYFATLFVVGTFRDFDRDAYPVLIGIMLIPLIVLILLIATGVI